jgi:hypothetical protein
MTSRLKFFLVVLFLCIFIIWFGGWTIYSLAVLAIYITPLTFQNLLILLITIMLIVASIAYALRYHKPALPKTTQTQPPKEVKEAVKDLENASEKLSVIERRLELFPEVKEVENEPYPNQDSQGVVQIIGPQEASENTGEETSEKTKNMPTEEDMRKRVKIRRLELIEATLVKVKEGVEDGSVAIEAAEDILSMEQSTVPPAKLTTRKDEKPSEEKPNKKEEVKSTPL